MNEHNLHQLKLAFSFAVPGVYSQLSDSEEDRVVEDMWVEDLREGRRINGRTSPLKERFAFFCQTIGVFGEDYEALRKLIFYNW